MKVCSVLGALLLIVMTAVVLMAQSQQQPRPTPPPPANPSNPGATPLPGTPSNPGVGQPVDPNKYSIGPEDVININVWRELDYSRTVAVRPDGKITMPLLGDLQAGGLTPLQLTQELTEKLSTLINHPEVTVTVLEVRSKKYYMDGEFRKTGEFPLITSTTVLQAISKTGGFQEFADQKHVNILRGGKILKFNYKEVIKGKHMEQNIELQNDDHVIAH